MEEGCEIEISGERAGRGGGGSGGGEGCSISGCSDKAEITGTSWEFCVCDVCVFCCVALWSPPEEKTNDG